MRGPALRYGELPTWALGFGIYLGWIGLTLAWSHLPAPGAIALAALLLALHGSFQHECVHGHPTRSRRTNALFAGWALNLWLPFHLYRESHLAHHASEELAHPHRDPESFYVHPDEWARLGRPRRLLLAALQTLVGRLVFGPPLMIVRTLLAPGRDLARWSLHLASAALVIAWLAFCGVPLVEYALAIWGGASLTLLRSFAEHAPHADPALRTRVVESPLGWLFLHNNLHVVHHDHPGLPWYAIPARWRAERAAALARGVEVKPGYASLLGFALRPKDPARYPTLARSPSRS